MNQIYTGKKGLGHGKYNGMARVGDWVGLKIKSSRVISNNGGDCAPAGTSGVVNSAQRLLSVTFDKCCHCGTVLHVNDLDYYSIELFE